MTLADSLEAPLGVVGRWFFLIGAFSAVFSSLLGVWQSVPYLFADVWAIFIRKSLKNSAHTLTSSAPYRIYLIAIAVIPMMGLFFSFKEVQKLYAIIGASFMPLLSIALLVLNGKRKMGGRTCQPSTDPDHPSYHACFFWRNRLDEMDGIELEIF